MQDKARSTRISSNTFRGENWVALSPGLSDTQEAPEGALRKTVLGRGKPVTLPVKWDQMETTMKIQGSLRPREEASLTSIRKTRQHDPAAPSSGHQKPSFDHRQNRKALGFGDDVGCKAKTAGEQVPAETTHSAVLDRARVLRRSPSGAFSRE